MVNNSHIFYFLSQKSKIWYKLKYNKVVVTIRKYQKLTTLILFYNLWSYNLELNYKKYQKLKII